MKSAIRTPSEPFCDSTLKLISLITRQSGEIDQGVTADDQPERRPGRRRSRHHVRLCDRRIVRS